MTNKVFKPIVRANKSKKFWMTNKAKKIAEENSWTFTGSIEPNRWAAYAAEFTSEDSDEPFYGWAVINDEEDFDFVFGSG